MDTGKVKPVVLARHTHGVGQNHIYAVYIIYTVYDRIFDEFPAKKCRISAVYKYIHMVLAKPIHIRLSLARSADDTT